MTTSCSKTFSESWMVLEWHQVTILKLKCLIMPELMSEPTLALSQCPFFSRRVLFLLVICTHSDCRSVSWFAKSCIIPWFCKVFLQLLIYTLYGRAQFVLYMSSLRSWISLFYQTSTVSMRHWCSKEGAVVHVLFDTFHQNLEFSLLLSTFK